MSGHSLPVEQHIEAEWMIPDPGTGKAINLQQSGSLDFATGASGETNTLPSPNRAGQTLSLFCRSHGGGNRVITVASAINQAGNTIMTFNTALDFIKLESVRSATSPAAFRWRVVANDGVSLS